MCFIAQHLLKHNRVTTTCASAPDSRLLALPCCLRHTRRQSSHSVCAHSRQSHTLTASSPFIASYTCANFRRCCIACNLQHRNKQSLSVLRNTNTYGGQSAHKILHWARDNGASLAAHNSVSQQLGLLGASLLLLAAPCYAANQSFVSITCPLGIKALELLCAIHGSTGSHALLGVQFQIAAIT